MIDTKKVIWTIVILLAIVVGLGALIVWWTSRGTAPLPEPAGEVTFPIASSSSSSVPSTSGGGSVTASFSLPLPGGGSIVTSDFIHNGTTVADVENPGSYVLAGSLGYCLADGTCPSGAPTTDYSITYSEPTHSFNIALLQEPLGTARAEAEQFLLKALGITEAQACALDYYVGTSYYVNSFYSGKNLGFSFCPGATQLPQ